MSERKREEMGGKGVEGGKRETTREKREEEEEGREEEKYSGTHLLEDTRALRPVHLHLTRKLRQRPPIAPRARIHLAVRARVDLRCASTSIPVPFPIFSIINISHSQRSEARTSSSNLREHAVRRHVARRAEGDTVRPRGGDG